MIMPDTSDTIAANVGKSLESTIMKRNILYEKRILA